ncbi:MAG: chloride channel protein [Oscillospiraceae bacterium]|nr:chloride channel protein [Oscillospiraceae bacterium]
MNEALHRVKRYLIFFCKWTALAILCGGVCGVIGALFYRAVSIADQLFIALGWLLYLLPVAGLTIALLYYLAGVQRDRGANLVMMSLRTGGTMPHGVVPRIFAGTVLTHLCGGSAGREGAALMIGAGVATWFERALHLKDKDVRLMTMCGMSALFAAVFGTPVTAAVFSMEVASVGVFHYSALYPCLAASLTGWGVSSLLGTEPELMPAIAVPAGDAWNILRVALLAVVCALCSILFLSVIHLAGHLYQHFLPNIFLRAAAGGVLVIAATLLLGTRDYNGAGMGLAIAAVEGHAVPWAFLAKILLTALTMGAGYKGGEIVPAFFIGAALGCTAGPLLGLDPGFAAAIGLTALFCSVVNCPIASIVLAVELFGGEGLWFFAVACGVSYIMSGYYSLYAEQKIVYSKLESKGE